METEITEEEVLELPCNINTEDQKSNIRRIIAYQKSQYLSSSSSISFSFSTASSFSSSSSSFCKSNTLIDFMKAGNTSLRRLFDMEHTSLATYLRDYSSSPIIKPIFLWGSGTDDGSHDDPWMSVKKCGGNVDSRDESLNDLAAESCFTDGKCDWQHRNRRIGKQKLTRTKSYRRLPRFSVWKCRFLPFLLRLKKLRIIICRRKS